MLHFLTILKLFSRGQHLYWVINQEGQIQMHRFHVYSINNISYKQVKMNAIPNQPQYKPVYYLQRPHSPKNMMNHANFAKNISLTMSIGANQNPYNFLPSYKTKQQLPQTFQSQTSIPVGSEKNDRQLQNQLRMIFKENASLREQNQNLKRQLQRFKKEVTYDIVRSSQKHNSSSPQPYNDLRGTIKKQMGEMKQMRIKLDMLSKQVKMYEEMIDKMDERIKKLSHDNSKKNNQIDELQIQLTKLDQLKDKTNSIVRMYNDLQSKFNDHQIQWMKWKQNWLTQKETYLQKIIQLERRGN